MSEQLERLKDQLLAIVDGRADEHALSGRPANGRTQDAATNADRDRDSDLDSDLDTDVEYALDLVTIIEAVAENPGAVLAAQEERVKSELMAQMKADGVEYEERLERLAEADTAGGVLLDGFPRNVIQAAWLDGYLAGRGTKLAGVVVLRVPDEELKRRLVGRAEKENRSDDADPAVVQRRIDTYKEQSEPCIAYYLEQGLVAVHEVDGVGSIDEIEARIRASVGG